MQIEKKNNFKNDIIIIDGLWGTGKSMLSPIISSMDRVENVKIEHIYEYTSHLNSLGKISDDAAIWILRNYADLSQYNNSIGREINLRWSDDSGFKNNPNKLKYIKRLFQGEGDKKIEEIDSKNLALCIMSHMILLSQKLLKNAFGDRLNIIEVMRHPLYMVNHWKNSFDRFDSSRNFTPSFFYNNIKVPWFADSWKEDFINYDNLEKSIISICKLYPLLEEKIKIAKNQDIKVLQITFENIIFDTGNSMQIIEEFIGRSHSKKLKKILRNQKIPRKNITQGRGHSNYGWKSDNKSDYEVYKNQINYIKNNCSTKIFTNMIDIIKWYEKKYPSKLSFMNQYLAK